MKSATVSKFALILAAAAACLYFGIGLLKPVAYVAAAERSIAVRSVPGTVIVRAERELAVRSDLDGRVAESSGVVGAEVKEGEALIHLDTGDIELTIQRQKLELEAARKVLERGSTRQFDLIAAQERLEDTERRFEAQRASKKEVDARNRDLDKLVQAIDAETAEKRLRVARLENDLKRLQRKLEKMAVRSPVDGVVTAVFAHKGDLIGSAQEVATVISSERIVEVKVSEENFAGVKVGQIARVKFLAYADMTFEARVSKTLPVADPKTQRYTVQLEVDLPMEDLVSGLTGEATITIDERDRALIVPSAAIIGNRVFVVQDGTVHIRAIEKGFSSLTRVEIVSGLAEGELVIVDDLDLFKDGDRVKPREI